MEYRRLGPLEVSVVGIGCNNFGWRTDAAGTNARTLWFGEAAGREALTHAGLLLAATRRIVVATGIANIYARDPVTMASGQKTLAEAYLDRFATGG